MDWQRCMNQAMEYIENTLSEKIDYAEAARYMNCSDWEFRRIFSFITQLPLSEYVRRRRLTRAALDIREGGKVIDAALRYGYESQAAFSRAFRQLYGFAPSQARNREVPLKLYPRLTFKLVMEDMGMDETHRTNIIGAGEVSGAISVGMDAEEIHETNSLFWDTKGSEVLGVTALPLYGAFLSEEKCRLLGDLPGKRVLEIGCGNGHSLQYLGEHGASELWGTDLSQTQLKKTEQTLSSRGISAKLICAPMEEDCGLPLNYFDIVCSIYAIGWTTDLEGTFRLIASCLKKDGSLIFSWSHPIHKCVAAENGMLWFRKCYFDESWYSVSIGGGTLSLSDRKLSTYVNALAKAGFVIEQLIEDSDSELTEQSGDDFARKAELLPVTFVIKARKL